MSGLVTNSILFSSIFTIRDRCIQTHYQDFVSAPKGSKTKPRELLEGKIENNNIEGSFEVQLCFTKRKQKNCQWPDLADVKLFCFG